MLALRLFFNMVNKGSAEPEIGFRFRLVLPRLTMSCGAGSSMVFMMIIVVWVLCCVYNILWEEEVLIKKSNLPVVPVRVIRPRSTV